MIALLMFVAASGPSLIAKTTPLTGCDSPLVDGHTLVGGSPNDYCPDGKPLLDGHTFPHGSVGSDYCPIEGWPLIEGRTTQGD